MLTLAVIIVLGIFLLLWASKFVVAVLLLLTATSLWASGEWWGYPAGAMLFLSTVVVFNLFD